MSLRSLVNMEACCMRFSFVLTPRSRNSCKPSWLFHHRKLSWSDGLCQLPPPSCFQSPQSPDCSGGSVEQEPKLTWTKIRHDHSHILSPWFKSIRDLANWWSNDFRRHLLLPGLSGDSMRVKLRSSELSYLGVLPLPSWGGVRCCSFTDISFLPCLRRSDPAGGKSWANKLAGHHKIPHEFPQNFHNRGDCSSDKPRIRTEGQGEGFLPSQICETDFSLPTAKIENWKMLKRTKIHMYLG